MFQEVTGLRSADAVFDQVAGQIIGGDLVAGDALPGERELSAQLGVSRGVVREALQRLAQSGLVDIKHGGATRVRSIRHSADMNLLGRLLVRADGAVDPQVLRSLLEMRISIGADAARLCGLRADAAIAGRLDALVATLESEEDLMVRQDIDLEFWETVIEGSQNIAYLLAYNGLTATYRPLREVVAVLVEPELVNIAGHRNMVMAIARGDCANAEIAARLVLESSASQWQELIDSLTWEEQ